MSTLIHVDPDATTSIDIEEELANKDKRHVTKAHKGCAHLTPPPGSIVLGLCGIPFRKTNKDWRSVGRDQICDGCTELWYSAKCQVCGK